jgi:hypothetical protein
MKKPLIGSLSIVLLMGSASMISCMPPQSFIPVKGNGTAIEKNYNVSDFQAIEVSGGFDVVLVQGNAEGLTLTAQENLFEYIEVEVIAGTLRIYTQNNIMGTRSLKARISFKTINRLQVSGGGDVVAETPVNVPGLDLTLSGGGDLTSQITCDELKCRISGGGDARIDGTAGTFTLEISGGGDFQSTLAAKFLKCRISGGGNFTMKNSGKATEADIEISGGGDMNADMDVETIKCSVSGGGNAVMNGRATQLDINLHGGGDFQAGGFASDKITFDAGGGSDLHVQALKELNGRISGGGDLYYSGGAENVNVDAKGGSTIHKD